MAEIGELLKLNRKDIGTRFHQDTVNLIMEMQEAGWRLILTTKGHGQLLAPDGKTRVGVSRNPDSVKYIRRGLNKYNAANGIEPKEEVKVRTVAQKWPCPRPGCPKVFMSEEKLNIHTGVDHEGKLKCPDCNEMFARPNVLGIHRSKKHGYVSPTKEKRLQQKANRAKKAARSDEAAREILQKTLETQKEKVKEAVKDIQAQANETADQLEAAGVSPEVTRQIRPVQEDLMSPIKFIQSDGDITGVSIHLEPDPADVQHIEFLDERDSWTLDLNEVGDMRLSKLEKIMKIAGLKMEIRVWKES